MKSDGQKASQRHEKRLEKAINGQRTAASGAFWSRKGDVRNDEWLVEHKYTAATSFSIKADVLDKIRTEAIMDGRKPALGISVGGRDYVLLLEDDWLELITVV